MAANTLPQLENGSKLWIAFRLNNEEYCVNSEHVVGLVIPEDIQEMPNDPPYMLGVMHGATGSLPVVDLRALFDMPTMKESVADFSLMRQMHLDWIEALKDTVDNHVPFTKAVDPHLCKFGKWYDNYDTENISMRFVLNKIGPPHEYIHRHGADVQRLIAEGDWDGARQKYEEAETICRQEVLPLLDQLIETYKEVNRGVVIMVRSDGQMLGLMADEVDALIPAERAELHPVPPVVRHTPYVSNMVLADGKTYAAVDVPRIVHIVDDKDAAARQIEDATQA